MSAAAPASSLTRITLMAPHRRVDLVLPSQTPLGTLLPEITTMLGYDTPQAPHHYRVSLLDGRVLKADMTLQSAGVVDGAQVRIDRVEESPMSPVVHDVVDEVAHDLAQRNGRWDAHARRHVCTAVVAAAAAWSVLLAAPFVPAALLIVAGVLVLGAGTGLALAGSRTVGTSLVLAGAAAAAVAVPFADVAVAVQWLAWVLVLAATVLAVGVANKRVRAGAMSATTLFTVVALWTLFTVVGLPWERTAALMALVGVLSVGLVPRVALVTSGLTRLDDAQGGDGVVARRSVTAALDAAHRGLALSVVFLAASLGVSGWVLAHAGDGWSVALTCLLVVISCLRVRAHPLTVEMASLFAAAAAITVGFVDHFARVMPTGWWGMIGVGVLGAGLLCLSYRPAEHLRARLRQVGDRLEGMATVAMVPVTVGAFEVYSRLLAVF